MKIGILSCDDYTVIGGAEKHFMDLAVALDADLVVPGYSGDAVSTYDAGRKVRFVSLDRKLPKEPLRQLAGMRLYSSLSLDYDFVICTDDMAVRYLRHRVPHFYYVLTPRRALYDMYYCIMDESRGLAKPFNWAILNTARALDRRFVRKHVANFACNSHNVRNRIFKVYQRQATVIYAPVHTERFSYRPGEGYWLSVTRVDKWKRIELQVAAFREMPERRLIVAGPVYPAYTGLVRNAPPNVQFLGAVDESTLLDLYSRADGFITTAIDEDFGMTPVEAMASGKPVVATREGGYLETVLDGYTGMLVAPDVPDICRAVGLISENPGQYRELCQARARLFDYEVFRESSIRMVEQCSRTGNE